MKLTADGARRALREHFPDSRIGASLKLTAISSIFSAFCALPRFANRGLIEAGE